MRPASILFLFTWCALSQPVVFRVNTVVGRFDVGNDGPALQAILGGAKGLLYDAQGALYVSDTRNHMIRRIERDGKIVAVAGSGVRGNTGDGGAALQASFDSPEGIALDGPLLYVADSGNGRVRVVNLRTGTVENYAGSPEGAAGSSGNGGLAGNAVFRTVGGLALDLQGNLLIADPVSQQVRRVNKNTGIITAFAGNGSYGFGTLVESQANAVALSFPSSLAVDTDGSVYIGNEVGFVAKVDPNGNIRRIAGSFRNLLIGEGIPAADSAMAFPSGLAIHKERRRLYVADYNLATIREVALDSALIFTTAGNANAAYGYSGDGGAARSAILSGPWAMTLDSRGQIAVSDIDNNHIRFINTEGVISRIAGRVPYSGDDGPAVDATIYRPGDAISDGRGGLIVADGGNCAIRRVSVAGVITRIAGRPGTCARANPVDGQPAITTAIGTPGGLARDRAGNIYFTESTRVRRIAAGTGVLTTLARDLRGAVSLTLDAAEDFLYVSESSGHRVTRINLTNNSVSILAGSIGSTPGFADATAPTEARFNFPLDIGMDSLGNLFVADSFNGRIRRIDPAGRVTTVAGTGSVEVAEGPAATTGVGYPTGLAVDATGVIYFTAGQRIWRINRGRVELIAGGPVGGFSGDGGFGAQARFNVPATLRLDNSTLIVTDQGNHRIRTLTPVRVSTLAVLSGDAQSAGTALPVREPLVVIVRLAGGSPAPGVPVTFSASAGTLSETRVVTGVDGRASATLTMPATAGPVTVTASVEDLPSVRFALTANQVITATTVTPRVTAVITAGSFGAATRIAPGTWMEIYGANFAANARQWSGDDFQGTQAPTTLAGVRVTVAGRPAFVQLVSPTQINAQVPDGIGTGPVAVIVTNAEGASQEFRVTAAERAPALLAPPAFHIGGKQYVAALHADGAFVGPTNLIAGAAFRPARAGDRLVLYGVGFGVTSPAVPAGQTVGGANSLANVAVTVGGQDATVEYGGLAGGFVGLYQFNIVMPAGVAPGDAALTVSAGGAALEQTLVLTAGI